MASSRRRHPAAGWALLCALPLALAARPRARPVHALTPTPTPTPLHPVTNPIGGLDPSVCSDMALVGNVSAHESRARIAQMGCPPPSLESSADELYSDLATCKRMRMVRAPFACRALPSPHTHTHTHAHNPTFPADRRRPHRRCPRRSTRSTTRPLSASPSVLAVSPTPQPTRRASSRTG